jgi:hypothetical protein
MASEGGLFMVLQTLVFWAISAKQKLWLLNCVTDDWQICLESLEVTER